MTGPNAAGIERTLQRFANCYESNNPAGSAVKIVAGVTNDAVADPQAAVTRNHGEAWGDLILRMNNWAASRNIEGQVSFNGGLDAEHSFQDDVDKVKAWVDGYVAENGNRNLFFYGDAEGCPSDKYPNWSCTWSANDIIDISWSRGEVTPFPQIYDEEPDTANPPTSMNAQRWQRLSKRSYDNGTSRTNFAGGLSQYLACQDVGAGGVEEEPCDAEARIAALNAKYEAMPPLSDPEAIYERNLEYERGFSQVNCGEAANGANAVELTPEDHEWNVGPLGIGPAPEVALPGYRPVNQWTGMIDGRPVIVASVTPEGERRQGGVLVQEVDRIRFIPSPRAVGPLAITSAHGQTLVLVGPEGDRFTFDVTERSFV